MPASPPVPAPPGPREPDPERILEFARTLIGLREDQIRALIAARAGETGGRGTRGKGAFGNLIESYFGLLPSIESEPDFKEAGVELKTLPLEWGKRPRKLLVKEPTSISMIDYCKLLEQPNWNAAWVRRKVLKILFVFYVDDKTDRPRWVKDVLLWDAEKPDEAVFEADWKRTRKWVSDGLAHELSETQAQSLAARRKGGRRKGPGGALVEVLRPQPNKKYRPDALSRAWALKSSFTRVILNERVLRDVDYRRAFVNLTPQFRTKGVLAIEAQVSGLLEPLEDLTLEDIAKKHALELKDGKSLAARLVRKVLGFEKGSEQIKEFEQWGVTVKTLHLRSGDGWPFEAISFPVVDLQRLVKQDFQGVVLEDGTVEKPRSDLADQVQNLLFVTTYSDHDNDPQRSRRLGRAFLWSPDHDQWERIAEEWTMFSKEVKEGKAQYDYPCERAKEVTRHNRLTPASRTKIIHMRPHGRTACDQYEDPLGKLVTKQCFWLNQSFVYRLLQENHALPPGAVPKKA